MQKLAQWAKRKKLAQQTKPKKLAQRTNRMWTAGGTALVIGVVGVIALVVYQPSWQPSWTGIGTDSTENIERDSTGKITKTIEVGQSGKTLWDLTSVLGVPVALTVLGFWFQRREQKRVDEQAKEGRQRAEQQAKLEKDIAAANQREEALQVYFDRLSTLLIDKNLIAIATRVKNATATDEDTELLNTAVNVIQARTLSILRQFGEDGERKSSVIPFLIEAEVINKLNINLSGANLSGVNLSQVDLSSIDLSNANLTNTNFHSADLSSARLIGATLCGTNFSHADLNYAKFIHANLNSAKFIHANLSYAELGSTDLSNANLSKANLMGACLIDANLRNADLRDASLNGANLVSADLRGANLNGVNLRAANLREAKGFKTEQLDRALLCKTKLPKGCNLDPDRDCKALEFKVKKSD